MATIKITDTTLEIRFRPWEKVAGLLRDLEVPRSAVTGVTVETDALRAARGLRAPGLAIPGVRKVGTWRGRGRRTMVSVRRNQPALRITLTGARYDELLLGVDDARDRAEQLRPVTR
jgi:hypothetical protein